MPDATYTNKAITDLSSKREAPVTVPHVAA